MDWGWWMGDMSERIMRMIREMLNGNRETSGKGEKGRIRMNRGKEGEQINQKNEKDQMEWCSIASLAGSERAKMRFCQRLNANG
ncbi:MAG: hypothetical protein ABIL86_10150 [candidate division WOR-3 bacterium]